MKFQREMFDDVFDEAMPLLTAHYHEVAHFKDIPLSVDRAAYSRIESNNAFRVFTARADDGELLGYAAYFLKNNLHYKESFQAVQDVIYIDKKRRGFGAEFIAWCDSQLQAEGVQAVYHHIKVAQNWGKVLERQGYEPIDIIYAKRLDKGV